MREIKFRVFIPEHGMFPVGDIELPDRGPWGFARDKNEKDGLRHYRCSEGAVLMQFTGLHDKNGKEIYEGDLLGGDGYKTLEVYWVAPTFAVANVEDEYDHSQGIPTYLEVIGNRFENPELLTNK